MGSELGPGYSAPLWDLPSELNQSRHDKSSKGTPWDSLAP